MDSQITNIVIADKCFKSTTENKYYFRVGIIYENNTCVVQYMYSHEIINIYNKLLYRYDIDIFTHIFFIDSSSLLYISNKN